MRHCSLKSEHPLVFTYSSVWWTYNNKLNQHQPWKLFGRWESNTNIGSPGVGGGFNPISENFFFSFENPLCVWMQLTPPLFLFLIIIDWVVVKTTRTRKIGTGTICRSTATYPMDTGFFDLIFSLFTLKYINEFVFGKCSLNMKIIAPWSII